MSASNTSIDQRVCKWDGPSVSGQTRSVVEDVFYMRSLFARLVQRLFGVLAAFSLAAWSMPIQAETSEVQVGKTKLKDAMAFWHEQGAKTIQAGYLAVGAGSGIDRASQYSVEQVVLVDESGTDFEGLTLARYCFVDEVLFSIQGNLSSVFHENKTGSNQLSKVDVDDLEKRLMAKYGQPNRSGKDLLAGKKPNILIWDIEGNELVLHTSGLQNSLTLANKELSRKAADYKRAECKKHAPMCS
jgi:hypothetical protein